MAAVVEVPPAVELPAAPVEKEALAKTIFGKDFEVRSREGACARGSWAEERV